MDVQFKDFLMSVPVKEQGFVLEMQELFSSYGCLCDISTTKQGYLVSYYKMNGKKKTTVANYVFRKTGVKIRIYASNIQKYQEVLNLLPDKVKSEIMKSGDCKRLYDATACNSNCKMGFSFVMDGIQYKKCRNMAFMPTLCDENDDYIRIIVENELKLM